MVAAVENARRVHELLHEGKVGVAARSRKRPPESICKCLSRLRRAANCLAPGRRDLARSGLCWSPIETRRRRHHCSSKLRRRTLAIANRSWPRKRHTPGRCAGFDPEPVVPPRGSVKTNWTPIGLNASFTNPVGAFVSFARVGELAVAIHRLPQPVIFGSHVEHIAVCGIHGQSFAVRAIAEIAAKRSYRIASVRRERAVPDFRPGVSPGWSSGIHRWRRSCFAYC